VRHSNSCSEGSKVFRKYSRRQCRAVCSSAKSSAGVGSSIGSAESHRLLVFVISREWDIRGESSCIRQAPSNNFKHSSALQKNGIVLKILERYRQMGCI